MELVFKLLVVFKIFQLQKFYKILGRSIRCEVDKVELLMKVKVVNWFFLFLWVLSYF